MINCLTIEIEPNIKELECRKAIMRSIENALKKGDEVFDKLTIKTNYLDSNYKKFKDSLKQIDHQNLKK